MPAVTDRSRNYAAAVSVALILAAVAIYLAKSISLPLGPTAHELSARLAAQASSEAPPGDMRLLPGYLHTGIQGGDSQRGRIVRLGGPVISYEIGARLADIMDNSGAVLWTKTHRVEYDMLLEGRTIPARELRLVM